MASAVQVESSFSGKTVLLTGATSGIGEASAIAFGRREAHVVVCGRDEARGRKVSEKVVAAGGTAALLIADLNDHQATLDLAKRGLDAARGRVDILINNAGGGDFAPSAAVSLSDYDRTFNLNARAPFFLTAAIAPTMVANGAGAIVNVSASSTIKGVSGLSLFAGAKGAVEAMTRGWAAEYGPAGVRVNAIERRGDRRWIHRRGECGLDSASPFSDSSHLFGTFLSPRLTLISPRSLRCSITSLFPGY
jgi:NAD(P)-dependent dehydrogenase (short-subunit alcohol dehydrogenase family)